jgi:hypothetical protein
VVLIVVLLCFMEKAIRRRASWCCAAVQRGMGGDGGSQHERRTPQLGRAAVEDGETHAIILVQCSDGTEGEQFE